MAEYSREQRNQLSRVIANGWSNRQLKGFVDNRQNALYQMNIIQCTPNKKSWNGGDLFSIVKSDLDNGTETSATTRSYVNDVKTPKPKEVLFDYSTAKTKSTGIKTVKNDPDAFSVINPKADKAYSSGVFWDAGHKLASQNGGYGHLNDWVFPQTPAYNQGNSMNMFTKIKDSFEEWRSHEQKFHEDVKREGSGCWWVKCEY